jgi:anti-sigma factor RsiW
VALKCPETQARFQEYATRELGPAARHEVDEHLLECADCRRELALLNAIVSALDLQPRPDPPAGFAARVLTRLPTRTRMPASPWWSLVLAPILIMVVTVFRAPLLRELAGVPARFGIRSHELGTAANVSGTGVQPLFVLGLALTALALAACVFGLVVGWKYYANEI